MHKTAVVAPGAELGQDVQVGPYAIIEAGSRIGDRTTVMAHAQVLFGATVGSDCRIFHGAVVGGIPQDLKYDGSDTVAVIGDNTTIREFVTVNRGSQESDNGTVIGSGTLLMAYIHVGHDTIIGDGVIIANSVQIGGFARIDDYASIGGITPVHQFCRVGTHAFVGGGFRIVQDVPPYILAMGEPLKYAGINSVGLKRRGFSQETRNLIKQAYRYIFRSEYNLHQAIEKIKNGLELIPELRTILEFAEQTERGLI